MIITIDKVTKNYRRRGRDFAAVDQQSLTIEPADFIAIVGPSGSGKTTFLHLLGGILAPTSGQILYDNLNLLSLSEEKQATFRNQHIGFIPQGNSLIPSLTVLDNLRLPLYLAKREHQAGAEISFATDLLSQLGIEELADEYPLNLSGGEQRRVAIARAFVNRPQLILADEPTNDLDDTSKEKVLDMFKRANQNGTSIVMVTHQQENLKYANQVLEMS